ncbi:M20 family metallopeptidase [Anoxybacterium hadale]|uniref:M20 family metallopeptidase n=1 Tax=Anoxybacterium hadale TaxID=3408580 RepID=A0ACD1AEC3_9FIRM|nr:M20 family metallopeptidase [Clostridiales bacterium]
MKDLIINTINERMDEFFKLSSWLYEHPELGEKEFEAAALLSGFFEAEGFEVLRGIYGFETAFQASCGGQKEGPHIALFCEYDALPQIGHGCGHNLISAMSVGAAVGLKKILEKIGGTITVFGTPAEETNGIKGILAEKGAFEGMTAAMMAHPNVITEESGESLALTALKFEFFGKAAHAAAMPEKGINALDAVILLFNGVNALRQHVPSDVRIHGIITDGGVAPNIVPDYGAARFYLRSKDKDTLASVIEKVKRCAEGAEAMTGASCRISRFENTYDNLRTNRSLSGLFTANLKALGEKEIHKASEGIGSIDIGNVSHVVPVIHPWIGVGKGELVIHTKEFADCTVTEQGRETLFKGACALAMTAYDVITSEEEQKRIREEFMRSETSE